MSAGIDYCYLVYLDSQRPWVDAVRQDRWRWFAPTLRFRLVAGWNCGEPFPTLRRPYVHIRDL